jgi:hypothetical protein
MTHDYWHALASCVVYVRRSSFRQYSLGDAVPREQIVREIQHHAKLIGQCLINAVIGHL